MRTRTALVITPLLSMLACGDAGQDPRDRVAASGAEALRADAADAADVDADIDILPDAYPNQLRPDDTVVEIAVDLPRGARLVRPHGLRASASSTFAEGAPVVSASSVEFRKDAGGRRNLVASFPVAALRSAGLMGPGTTRLRVRIETPQGATLTGEDRLFEQDAFIVVFPRPTGRHPVGTTSSVLFDPTRPGATAAGRELVLRLWYPAASSEEQPTTYFLNDREAELNAQASRLPGNIFDGIHTWSALDVRPAHGAALPALVLSTGLGAPLTFYSEIAEDLASHGYVVVGVEHPVGSGIVVYPDGSVSAVDPGTIPLNDLNRDWATDLELVGRWLASQSGGRCVHDVPAAGAALALVDPARIGVFGHSFGGAASVWAASESPIFRASVNVDGMFWGDMLERAPSTPVLILLGESHTDEIDPTIGRFSGLSDGPLYTVQVAGAGHNNFGDVAPLVVALAALDPTVRPADFGVGSIDPARALAIESAYVRAFFDLTLRHEPSPLLDGPSPGFPEVTFVTRRPVEQGGR